MGGAEAVVAETAVALAARGWDVEILTTCAQDHYTWANHYPAGESQENGIIIRRFPTVTPRRNKRGDQIGGRILAREAVPIQDQQVWMNSGLRVPDLWHHLLDHGTSYRAVVVAPYMFWTSFACGQIAPERTIVMPCLHDEPFAYLDLFQPLINGAAGVWFLSDPERDLAESIFRVPRQSAVVGAGVAAPALADYDIGGFRSTFGLTRPFVFYAGRREWGKGWQDLLRAFEEAVSGGAELDLVTSGVGDTNVPTGIRDRVVDLGFISDRDRNNAMAAAAAYVQPSANESFSRTVLEAWLAGTLVVANADSAVVSWHVERSRAGLTYSSDIELVEALRIVGESPDGANELARPGRNYVLEHYEPGRIIDAMEATLWDWTADR